MRRCDFCGGGFGLISHRLFGKRFCRKRCRRDYFAARLQKMRSKIMSRGVVWRRRGRHESWRADRMQFRSTETVKLRALGAW